MLQREGLGDDATAVAESLFPSMKQATASPAAVGAARRRLAAMIDSAPAPKHVLSVSVSGVGTVTGPGIHCPGDCTANFSDGIPVSLTATPGAGAKLGGWNGACAGAGGCRLTTDGDKAVGASFSTRFTTPGRILRTTIVAGPSRRTRDRTPTYRLASNLPGARFQCRVDGQRWRACSARAQLRLRRGRHRLVFRALSLDGGTLARPAHRRVRIVR
jgi:hypothetical protein